MPGYVTGFVTRGLMASGLMLVNPACRTSSEATSAVADADQLAGVPALYGDGSALEIEIGGPFKQLNQSGATLIESPLMPGWIRAAGVERPMQIRTRGSTSLLECGFKKLKIEFPDEVDLGGTPFKKAREIKVGTHCDVTSNVQDEVIPESGFSRFGRLKSDKVPHREALVLRIFQLLQPWSLASRPVQVTYVYADELGSDGASRRLVKPAVLIERTKIMRERAGILEPPLPHAVQNYDQAALATLFLYQTLVINSDWQAGKILPNGLAESDRLWNVDASMRGDQAVVTPNDMDLSGFVTDKPGLLVVNEELPANLPLHAFVYRQKLAVAKTMFAEAVWRDAFNYVARRQAVLDLIGTAPVDEEGRAMITARTTAFFDELRAAVN